ncbi:MOSC domain-containing protein YiiM [Methylocapsa palsarum]|uniref:MOSC domain-containing protein YiiM n=1 Tax=Methylocapsa palsarum TaxID=1612308 RepID=A0A1I4A4G3_9HYPH|nr:MOSC domain-containing protein YiiM [Methylocapsa palsarum]
MGGAGIRISSIQAGRIAPLGPRGVLSGFVKDRVDGPISAGLLGLSGDEQADLTVHGGPEKAVYGYGLASYAAWRRAFPDHAGLLKPGGLGENLTIDGQEETSVCIGDIVRVGGAVLQVTQPRQPCFKLALRFADNGMPRAMIRNGLCGWYYRVLEPGVLTSGTAIVLEERPNPEWSVARFFRLITTHRVSEGELAELVAMNGLASQWRASALNGAL